MTIFECYNTTKKQLKEAGIEDYAFEARQILRYITNLSNSEIITRYADTLDTFKTDMWQKIVDRRKEHYPLQYILGRWSFYGLEFYVGEGCLIPRSDTETLVDCALSFLENKKGAKVLDLCAGSGCIGITLGKRREDLSVTLLEKYPVPFDYCLKNIKKNFVEENVKAVMGDVFDYCPTEKYDLILSNPPYISASDMAVLQEEVTLEPDTALYGGEDGLDYYRVIIRRFKEYLGNGAMLAFEVGIGQSEAVAALLKEAKYGNIGVEKDLGGVQRVVYGTLN